MPAGRLLAFRSAMIESARPAFFASGAWANHSTCERHCRPTIRMAISLSFVGTDVSAQIVEHVVHALRVDRTAQHRIVGTAESHARDLHDLLADRALLLVEL